MSQRIELSPGTYLFYSCFIRFPILSVPVAAFHSDSQMLETTLLHEFHILYSQTKWNLLFTISENCEIFWSEIAALIFLWIITFFSLASSVLTKIDELPIFCETILSPLKQFYHHDSQIFCEI